MPNWCENTLTVSCDDVAELSRFKEFAKTDKSGLDFNRFVPYPQEYINIDCYKENLVQKYKMLKSNAGYDKMSLIEQIKWDNVNPDLTISVKDGFNSGGYEWCVKNWGTKWHVEVEADTNKKGNLVYRFDTAWSPPVPVVKKMGEMFKSLCFELEYTEEGCGFKGFLQVEDGEVTIEECEDYYGGDGDQ